MSHLNAGPKRNNAEVILHYCETSSGLSARIAASDKLTILQAQDQKFLTIELESVVRVIERTDVDGRAFLQLDFVNDQKILLTDQLIGFKPAAPGAPINVLMPRVVTTPDLLNVLEAIQGTVEEQGDSRTDMKTLAIMFESIVKGGEAIGLDFEQERSWLARVPKSLSRQAS